MNCGRSARPPGGWDGIAAAALDAIVAANQFRQPRDLADGNPRTALSATGRAVVSFASNDYLGLTQHPAVRAAARGAVDAYGTGSGSARLIVGSRPVHSRLEERIAAWRGTEAAVLFTTGYAANLGVIATMGRWASVVCSDELNHASIIDGCRLARAPTRVYPHCDPAAVDELLAGSEGRGMVVSDSVFSMDGDLAPIAELSAVCAAHGALLILDDAHLVVGHPDPVHPSCRVLRVGTLSKAVGSLGGFVCGPESFADLLVNRARSYIFTTAAAPAAAAAAIAAIDIIDSAEGDDLRARLRANIDRLRPGHPSPIIPIIVGHEDHALAASEALARQGILVPAIRPPTVPAGTSRLRVTVSAAHTRDDLDRLVEALREAGIDG
ncbi:MAG: aminotransferase class I/II-fold pyridoxal phosphate-dependent enzyme [Acidimicrobiaceae bacterium]|nr:aminotransferase class I/II-fold pyridoxal phosphate-dependent enzyme [Acidimicrobiaceae bacterium]